MNEPETNELLQRQVVGQHGDPEQHGQRQKGQKLGLDEAEAMELIMRRAEMAESTFWGYLGCKLEKLEQGKVEISLDAGKQHLNPIGLVHGGVLASLLDNAMGIAVMLVRPNDKTVTTNLNIHYVSTLYEGKLRVTAEVLHQSRKMLTTTGTVWDAEGKIATIGTGTFRVTS